MKLGFARVRPVRAVGVGALSYLLVWPVLVMVLVPLSSLFEKLGLPNQTHPIVDQLQAAGNDPRTLAMWLVIAAVLAPLLEEAVFRGALQSALQGRLGGVFALIATALLFAIIHPQVGLGLVGVLVLGLMLSLVRLHERSLWPGVVLHAINNGVALLIVTALLSP
ncbi:MAG: CPBP family intramembrane glutamic endopeptidase [Polyangiaceae bacterium]